MMKALTVAAALAALAALAPTPALADLVAIEGATVHPRPGQTLEGATVLVRGGVIAAVGTGVTVPEGATVIDGRGKVVTAGFVDAATRLGLVAVDAVGPTNEGEFSSDAADTVHAAYRVTDGYDPRAVTIPTARAQGVTSAVAVPTGALVSGRGAWMSLAAGSVPQLVIEEPVALYVTLGRGALEAAGGSRGMALERLRELFDDAAQYRRSRARYERNQSRPLAAERLDLEALAEVLARRVPLVVRVHRAADIVAALRLGRELSLPIVIEGGTEAHLVAAELAAADAAVIANPVYNLPSDFDRVHVRDDAVTILQKAGVPVALSTLGAASGVGRLRQLAGIAVSRGLSWDQALAAVTTAPAAIFGVERGVLEPGAAADLVVWSGDPFELSTRAERVFIGGVEQPLDTHQSRLLERYRRLDAPTP